MDCENSFTREELEDMLSDPGAQSTSTGTVRELARSLLAEMDKPKVWDGAPEWATDARLVWNGKNHSPKAGISYFRDLPKSRAREIAEEEAARYASSDGIYLSDFIESAILKREAELKEGKE